MPDERPTSERKKMRQLTSPLVNWLERARDAKTDEERLTNLVGAWRAQPHVSIYELATVAGARAARSPKSDWLEVARRRDPAELDWVLANLEIRKVDVARE